MRCLHPNQERRPEPQHQGASVSGEPDSRAGKGDPGSQRVMDLDKRECLRLAQPFSQWSGASVM